MSMMYDASKIRSQAQTLRQTVTTKAQTAATYVADHAKAGYALAKANPKTSGAVALGAAVVAGLGVYVATKMDKTV